MRPTSGAIAANAARKCDDDIAGYNNWPACNSSRDFGAEDYLQSN
jgi:hypothetical protein